MSFWGAYEEQLHGGYPTCNPEYMQYYNNMPYYNDQPRSDYGVNNGFNFYNGESYQTNYLEQPGPSQVTSSDNFATNVTEDVNGYPQSDGNRGGGNVKKKQNEKNRSWNNNRKNERYGSGRTFNRSKSDFANKNKVEHRKTVQEPGEFVRNFNYNDGNSELSDQSSEVKEATGSKPKNKFNSKQADRNYYQSNKQRNNYDDRRNNYRSRDNRYESYYDNRGYGKYAKSNNRYYDVYSDNGASGGREEYPREKNYWRKFDGNSGNKKCNSSIVQKKLDAASQRERLEQMLSRRMLECLVCCERIKHTDKIWSCSQCHHILHLSCTAAWAHSSRLESGWRCPACQNTCAEVPRHYACYCGKTRDPRPLPGVVPHACGEPCMRARACEHPCPILCHPGPCPECEAMVARPCGCGATTQTAKCSAEAAIVCGAECGKALECGLHRCKGKCHGGECPPCGVEVRQTCHCGKQGRKVRCTAEVAGKEGYSCEDVCGKVLGCGNHRCQKVCHEGECEPCVRDVSVVKTCPCGRKQLGEERKSCLDPIPCCDKICAKPLSCGQPSAPHTCQRACHEGPCPACPLSTLVRCRCGHMDRELPCAKLQSKADDARCEKKCTKKRLCGKHRCNQKCCIEAEHVCPLPCNHLLACGHHRCERNCHSGRCPSCTETSFEELYCECGANVLYPPIKCGTKPPPCGNPCSRPRACRHDVNHNCHVGACPPCTVLCKRWCYGKHEQRAAIPCYQEDFSCGLPCGKPMPCGAHKCEKPCHLGPCPLPCKQKCNIKRPQCGHPCGAPCHKPPCPETPCKQNVPTSCPCGLQKGTKACIELADEYKELEMTSLKDKMSDLLKDQPVDISDIVNKPKKPTIFKILECNEECRVLERNRRLAIGLQIRNPDLSQKLTPRFSDFMRGWAKKDPQFCQKIHDKLTELVQLAKQSKQKSRSYSFDSMNRDKRHFVHEYCEHFGCESAAYDMEPNRNIVATAFKDKSWLPSISLLEFIQRENGQRKVPGPVLSKGLVGKSETVALKLPGRVQRPSTPPGETVDYFDNPPV